MKNTIITISIILMFIIAALTSTPTDYKQCRTQSYFDTHTKCADWYTEKQVFDINSRDEVLGYKTIIISNITKR